MWVNYYKVDKVNRGHVLATKIPWSDPKILGTLNRLCIKPFKFFSPYSAFLQAGQGARVTCSTLSPQCCRHDSPAIQTAAFCLSSVSSHSWVNRAMKITVNSTKDWHFGGSVCLFVFVTVQMRVKPKLGCMSDQRANHDTAGGASGLSLDSTVYWTNCVQQHQVPSKSGLIQTGGEW